jgi:mRNA-degrading endonuclease RelE of RelBE toxin-antitoxin system
MDKIAKALKKLSVAEKRNIKYILQKIKSGKYESFDIKKLKGHDNIYRVRKGKFRVIFFKKAEKISVLAIERKGDNTYNL